MDRDRRLCELMGVHWHENHLEWLKCDECVSDSRYPNFSTPEWRTRLMDWATEQEWWDGFVEKQKSIFLGKWVRGEIDGKPWVNPESEFITYLWRNFADLIVEYHGEGR